MDRLSKRIAKSWAVLLGQANTSEAPAAPDTTSDAPRDSLVDLISKKDGLGSVTTAVFYRYEDIRKARSMGYSWAKIAAALNMTYSQSSPLAVAFNKARKERGDISND